MSCNVTIVNKAVSPTILTLLVEDREDGELTGKGKVIFSREIRAYSTATSNVGQPLAMIGISNREYQPGEVVDLDILTNKTNMDCGQPRVTATWTTNNMFEIRYQ